MMRFKLSQKSGLYNYSVNILLGQKNKIDFLNYGLKISYIYKKMVFISAMKSNDNDNFVDIAKKRRRNRYNLLIYNLPHTDKKIRHLMNILRENII